MFWKKKAVEVGGNSENPYLAARREWNAQMGSTAASANNWRVVALVMSLVALASVFGLVTLGASKDVVPYVVVLDQSGTLVSAGTPAGQAENLDQRVVKALLGNFIGNLRTVTADGAAQQAIIKRLYNTLSAGDPAYRVINEYFSADGNPFSRAKNVTVSVQLSSILQLSAMTYQIEWSETVRSRDGKITDQPEYQGVLTLRQVDNLTGAQQLDNPIGLFVEDIKWTKRL